MRRPLARAALVAIVLLTAAALPLGAAEEATLFLSLMPDYDAARTALANDHLGELARPAHALRQAIDAVDAAALTAEQAGVKPEQLGAVRELLPDLRKAAHALVASSGLVEARTAFGDLSKSLIAWRKLIGSGPDVGFCPMVPRQWLQPAGTPAENPYAGRAMATCGDVGPPHR